MNIKIKYGVYASVWKDFCTPNTDYYRKNYDNFYETPIEILELWESFDTEFDAIEYITKFTEINQKFTILKTYIII